MSQDPKTEWEQYCANELTLIEPILTQRGYTLESEQPHLRGERYLMQAVTTQSGRKLILVGTDATGRRVIIKATRDAGGIREIEHERVCREILEKIRFAYETFDSPKELLFTHEGGFSISIQAFVEQQSPFLARPIEEQFSYALRAFKAQEGAYASTYEHERIIQKTFGTKDATAYIQAFEGFSSQVLEMDASETNLESLLAETKRKLTTGTSTIDQYGHFLTHTDFVPHNFRIFDDRIYLLDHSSLRFGNKYEGWARFLNFMTLHNRPLEHALVEYVKNNRTPEESESLWLMRLYRLGEIISYYVRNSVRSTGNLQILSNARIHFWSEVLTYLLRHEEVPMEKVLSYTTLRDSLRSEEETERQKNLH